MALPFRTGVARTARLAAVVLAATCAAAVAPPAQALPRQPVKAFTVTCAEPDEGFEFGAAVVDLTFRGVALRKDDFFVVVPVNDATGLDAGDRIGVDRRQTRATVVVPADGTALTPATTVEVRLGGDVVQRIGVPAGCGVIDPDPDQGPVIGPISSVGGTVTVPVTNVNDVADDIGVTLWPAGSDTGDNRFLALAPGQTGSVSFTGVPPGVYTVEAFGYVTFTQTRTEPFSVG